MTDNGIMQKLVELLLSWMRLVTSWVWDFFQADRGSGFIAWFTDHWMKLAVILILIGAAADWLIWMIRWRPYWLWLRKRQIIYEEVAPKRQPAARAVSAAGDRQNEFYDPFAAGNEQDPYAPAQAGDEWDSDDDPYENIPSDEDGQ